MGNNERGSSSSSRKGKKSSDQKSKQPQRGLGVAQLEKIRLHGQLACSYHPNLHVSCPSTTHFNQEDMRVQAAFSSASSGLFPSSVMPGMLSAHDQYERTNIRYIDSQPTTTSSWIPNTSILESQHFVQPSMAKDPMHTCKRHIISHSMRSGGQNSDSSDTQELDLELRLSL